MLKKEAQAALASVLHDSHSGLAGVLRRGNLGSGLLSGEMRLGRGLSCAKRALLFRFSSTHGATDRQYMSQRELLSFHVNIIQHRGWERWSIVLSQIVICGKGTKSGINLEKIIGP